MANSLLQTLLQRAVSRPEAPKAPLPNTFLPLPNDPAVARAAEDYRRMNPDVTFSGVRADVGENVSPTSQTALGSARTNGQITLRPKFAALDSPDKVAETFAHEMEHIDQFRNKPNYDALRAAELKQPYEEQGMELEASDAGEDFLKRFISSNRAATVGNASYQAPEGAGQQMLRALLASRKQ